MNEILNKQKLEATLIANWTEFINIRNLLNFAEAAASTLNIHPGKPEKLTISRFELTAKGFLIWIDFKIRNIEITSEVILDSFGELHPVKTLIT